MKRRYAPFAWLVLPAVLATLMLHGQSVQTPLQQDKSARAVATNATVVFSPTDTGVNGAALIATTGTIASSQIPIANSHTVLFAWNCNQTGSTLTVNPVFEDGSLGTVINGATVGVVGWNYLWVSDTMTPSSTATAATGIRLPLGKAVVVNVNNTNASAATCSLRVIVQY